MMKVFKGVCFVGLFCLLFACGKEEANCVAQENQLCACEKIYAPVCGCDKVTYANACMAECVGITSFRSGTCEE